MFTSAMVVRRRLALSIGIVVLCFILVVDALLGFPFAQKFTNQSGRIAFVLVAWSMFLDAPILGHGLHSFGLFYQSYLSNLGLPSWIGADPRPLSWAHNLYAQVLAEQGIVGITALMFLLIFTFSVARKTMQAGDQKIRALITGILGALFGFCAAAMFDSSFMREWVVVIFFILIGIISSLSFLSTQKEGGL
jgi:O-antigen ligase